jgi:hypothetical protein
MTLGRHSGPDIKRWEGLIGVVAVFSAALLIILVLLTVSPQAYAWLHGKASLTEGSHPLRMRQNTRTTAVWCISRPMEARVNL